MHIPDAAVGSVIAAMIAGLVVFISTVLSKEQKTSEFRQEWIDELRTDVAQYVSGTIEFAALYLHKKKLKQGEDQFLDENFASIRELQAIEHRILLRLNPIKHAALVTKIRSFRSSILALYSQGLNNKALEATLTDALTNDCKEILKSEWERVKAGEPAFRIVKWVAIIIAAVLGLLLLWLMFATPSSAVAAVGKNNEQPVQAATSAATPPAGNFNSQSVQVTIASPAVTGADARATRHNAPLVQKSAPKTKAPVEHEVCKSVAPCSVP